MRKILIISLVFCIGVWSFRFWSISRIITSNGLYDFNLYYNASKSILSSKADLKLILKSTYGPPFVILPYIPFAFIPQKIAEYLITFLNFMSFLIVFYFLWLKSKLKVDWKLPLFLGLLSFSFPLQLSLGMGNPAGIVTLGIYSWWMWKNSVIGSLLFFLSGVLKIFPFVASVVILTRKNLILYTGLTIFTLVCSYIMLPKEIWVEYKSYSKGLYNQLGSEFSENKYNQSFAATMTRFGFNVSSFGNVYWLFSITILLICGFNFLKHFINKNDDRLNLVILLMCGALLIHPFCWQHYFTVLLPMSGVAFIKTENKLYLLVLLLLSLDLSRFTTGTVLSAIMGSSQFIGCLILFLLLAKKPPTRAVFNVG